MAVKKVKAWAVWDTLSEELALPDDIHSTAKAARSDATEWNEYYNTMSLRRFVALPCTITITPTKTRAGRKGRRRG